MEALPYWITKSYLVVDFEFTTYSGTYGRPRAFFPEIIEVGAVLMEPPEYRLDRTYQAFIKPRFFPRLTEACKNIAIVKQSDIDNGIPAEEMLGVLAKMCVPGATYFVSWGEADREVLAEVCRRYGLNYPFAADAHVDLSQEYRAFYKHPRRISLQHALEERSIERLGFSHLALDDAKNTGQILLRMLADGWRPHELKANAECG